ncbi:MAG TPA: sialidase family protein [Clostridia bacterium]
MKSYDSGYTWVNAGATPYLETYTFVRGQITLKNGTILIPYQRYPVTQEQNDWLKAQNTYVWKAGLKYVHSGVLLSYDGGKTFEKGGEVDTLIEGKWVWSEPTIIELSDNSLVMLLRMDGAGCLYRSNSYDGGKSWSEPEKTDIPNPGNKVKLLKFDDGPSGL